MDKLQSVRVLNLLYDMVYGIADEDHLVGSDILAQRLGLDQSTTLDLASYLQGKKLLKISRRMLGADFRQISITEEGVKEIEAARENKETPSEKYPPGMFNQIINYGSIKGSIIQGSSNVQSTVNITDNNVNRINECINLR